MLTTGSAGAQRAFGWRGDVTVSTPDGVVLAQFPNLITDAGLDVLVDALASGTSARIGWLAVGSGAAPAAAGDTQLGAEFARYAVESSRRTATGRILTRAYLAGADAAGTIRELGWFAGSSASRTRGSGVLVARVAYSHAKGDLESLVIDRTDTIRRG